MKIKNMDVFKKILLIMSIFVILASFVLPKYIYAASSKSKLKDGEFYYSGTTGSSYGITKSFSEWIIEELKEASDYILGMQILGIKGIIVGYGVVLEELVTWALETTIGKSNIVERDLNDVILDGDIKTSNNVTIEAIIYNRIPILNVNLFRKDLYGTVTGTGQYIVECDTCYIEQLNEKPIPTNNREKRLCKDKNCDCISCLQYLAEEGYYKLDSNGKVLFDNEGNPVREENAITIIKDNVSKFYYITRYLSIACMLIVLIVLGIKLAISTIATDKAIYKKMILDWVAGFVLIFSIHYVMVFFVNMNDTIVEFFSDIETGVSQLMKKEYYFYKISNKEMEINIYKAVRAMANDIRFSISVTGSIMYVGLVFLTIKYLFTYLKRYLTVLVLTLVAPFSALAFALQKVMTGKSGTFKAWLKEYVLNVFLQSVHALIYTIMMPIALFLALDGPIKMIIAIVFLGFLNEAEEIFRKMFGLSDESTNSAMNAANDAKKMANNAKGIFGGAMVADMVKKSPLGDLAKAPKKILKSEAYMAAINANSKSSSENNKNIDNKEVDIENEIENGSVSYNNQNEADSIITDLEKIRNRISPTSKPNDNFEKFRKLYSPRDPVGPDGEQAMGEELNELENIISNNEVSKEDQEKLKEIREKYNKYKNDSAIKAMNKKISEVLDKNKYYEHDEKSGKMKRKYGVFGKLEYDRKQNKWVLTTISDLVEKEAKKSNVLGMSEFDKISKSVSSFGKNAFMGMGSAFVGLGSIVSNPAAGLGLLATSVHCTMNCIDKLGLMDPNREYNISVLKEKNKKYSFNRFSKGAKRNIAQSILQNAQQEQDKVVVENVKGKHSKLYNTLRLGGAGLIVAGTFSIGALATAPVLSTAGVASIIASKGVKVYSGYSKNSIQGKLDKQVLTQINKCKKEVAKDEIKLLLKEENKEFEENYEELSIMLDENLEKENSEVSIKDIKDVEELISNFDKTEDSEKFDIDIEELKKIFNEEESKIYEKPNYNKKKNLNDESLKNEDKVLEEITKIKKQQLEELVDELENREIEEKKEYEKIVQNNFKLDKKAVMREILTLCMIENSETELDVLLKNEKTALLNNIKVFFTEEEQKKMEDIIKNIDRMKRLERRSKDLDLNINYTKDIKEKILKKKHIEMGGKNEKKYI